MTTKPSLKKARKLLKQEVASGRRVFINQLVLLETEWVLRRRYGLAKTQMLETISGLLDAPDVQLEDEPAVEEAVFVWRDTNADFADCLIAARNRRLGCETVRWYPKRTNASRFAHRHCFIWLAL